MKNEETIPYMAETTKLLNQWVQKCAQTSYNLKM